MTAVSVSSQKNIVIEKRDKKEKKGFFTSVKEAFALAAPGIASVCGSDNYYYTK
ncbi:MAG: hypothetical protein SOT28_00815 [Fusicatenibacter sp.]|nr:hypothetical protein [Lachnospiraceae bacterium]MDY2936848.1 hypothetical protein [Fusicatenibacter sp.]